MRRLLVGLCLILSGCVQETLYVPVAYFLPESMVHVERLKISAQHCFMPPVVEDMRAYLVYTDEHGLVIRDGQPEQLQVIGMSSQTDWSGRIRQCSDYRIAFDVPDNFAQLLGIRVDYQARWGE